MEIIKKERQKAIEENMKYGLQIPYSTKEPKVNLVKMDKEYKVEFWVANQGFTLQYGGTKTEATWMAKMLAKAFRNMKKSFTNESK